MWRPSSQAFRHHRPDIIRRTDRLFSSSAHAAAAAAVTQTPFTPRYPSVIVCGGSPSSHSPLLIRLHPSIALHSRLVLNLRSFSTTTPTSATTPPIRRPTKLDGSSTQIPQPELLPPPPTGSFWQLLLVALTATVAYGVIDYFWQRSTAKARIESRIGFPLDVLETLKDAREQTEQGLIEKERFDAVVRRKREERRKQDLAEEEQEKKDETRSDANHPLMPEVITSPDEGVAILFSITPSLLEAERLYRRLLSRLKFRGIDLVQLHQWVAEGTPTPAMRAVSQGVDPELRRRLQQQIDQVMNQERQDGQVIDKRVVPYVLNLLAYNLQLQAEVLKEHDEMNNPALAFHRPPKSSVAYHKFVESESYYLQSLTLYRHHFQFDRRPYAIHVMEQLGSLYFDMAEYKEAEAVWMKSLELLVSAKRSLTPSKKQKSKSDASESSELNEFTDSALPASYAQTASQLAEKLALVHRTRGDYMKATGWMSEALTEWDEYASQLRASKTKSIVPSSIGTTNTHTISAYELAIQPLPRALHLLTALTADLYAAGSFDQAYQTNIQCLQVLERLMQLYRSGQKSLASDTGVNHQQMTSSTDKSIKETKPSSGDPSIPTLATQPHQPYLSSTFLRELNNFLSEVHQPHPSIIDSTSSTSTTSSASDLYSTLPGESAAAYYNLGILLKRQHHLDADAKLCLQEARQLAAL